MTDFKKILIANRGEIAIRIMRAANEMGKKTVAVFAEEDKLGLHRFKADEAYRIGAGLGPVAAYLSIDEIIRVAKASGADAIHPGYGLLSENPDFVDACAQNGITFIGPRAETTRPVRAVSPWKPVCRSCPRRMYWATTWSSCGNRLQKLAIRLCSRHLGGVVDAGCAPSTTKASLKKKF